MYNKPSSGWIEVICGSMFSGKTEELIRRVASHNGMQVEAVPVESTVQLRALIDPDTTVVALDEAQFFDDDVVALCGELANQGRRVIVAGLDMDFRGEPFGPMPQLMAQAERVDKVQAICVVCGGPASRTQRLINGQPAAYGDPVILVGASEVYEARCRGCHVVPTPKPPTPNPNNDDGLEGMESDENA